MKQSILENVPCFEKVSFQDILAIRDYCEDELSSFRVELKKLATFVTKGTLDYEKQSEILDLISNNITPIVNEIERKIKLSRSKWVKRLIDKSTSLQTLATLTSTIFAGLPLHYGLIIAAGFAGVQAGLETYFDIKDQRTKSGLSFLLKLRKIKK